MSKEEELKVILEKLKSLKGKPKPEEKEEELISDLEFRRYVLTMEVQSEWAKIWKDRVKSAG